MKNNFIIALKLFVITALSACLIAITNYFTAPIIQANKDKVAYAAYIEIFEDFNSVNSKFKTYDDGVIYQEIEVYDANNSLVGFLYSGRKTNSFGTIDLIVGINPDGTLKEVVTVEVSQTKGGVDDHINNAYQSGMTQTDIENIDTKNGVTVGSNTAKDIVLSAYQMFTGDFTDYVKEASDKLFGNISGYDYSKTITKKVNYQEDKFKVNTIYTIMNNNNIVIGYMYDAFIDNSSQYSTASLQAYVGIDLDGKLVDMVEIEYIQSYAEQFKDYLNNHPIAGKTEEEIANMDVTNSGVTGTLTAMKEMLAKVFVYHENNSQYRMLFPEYDASNSTRKEYSEEIIYQEITVRDENNQLLGYIYNGRKDVYSASGKKFGYIDLMVGVNIDLTIKEVLINDISQTKDGVDEHVNNAYAPGMTQDDVDKVDTSNGVTYGSNVAKEIVKEALNKRQKNALDTLFTANYSFDNTVVEQVNYKDDKFQVNYKYIVKDDSGNIIGYMYDVFIDNSSQYSKASLQAYVGIDLNGSIIDMLEINYVQSYATQFKEYLDKHSISSKTEEEIANMDITNSGVTGTLTAMKEMLAKTFNYHNTNQGVISFKGVDLND